MKSALLFIILCFPFLISALEYPPTEKIPVKDNYHGTEVIDNYRWLEDMNCPRVHKWIETQTQFTKSILNEIELIPFLSQKLNEIWRYDDTSLPIKVSDGTRLFYTVRKASKEQSLLYTQACEESKKKLLLDPNTWQDNKTLQYWKPSRDGKYLAYGKAQSGDESPILYIKNIETGEILPDRVNGWRQRINDWLPDGSGFYYTANPLKGEVPDGEEYYWGAVYLHILGTPKEKDKKIWYSDEAKELFHWVYLSEDGKWEIFGRGIFHANEVFIRPYGTDIDPIPVITGFNGSYSASVYDNKLFITTNDNAPNRKVYTTDPKEPQRVNWKTFIPETDNVLTSFQGIDGIFYATYLVNGYTEIKAYGKDGKYIRNITLPAKGSAYISGKWKENDTHLYFNSFSIPDTVYSYDSKKDTLSLIKPPRDIFDTDNLNKKLIHYESKDKTIIPMFLIYNGTIEKNKNNPIILSGYGGFNISQRARFSSFDYALLQTDIIIARPMLRGGGEFGRKWHEAGMLENKQNTFDDFIYAAKWLIENNYTNPARIGIQGGSNGGLLVGAVTVQRPDLFKAVLCQVPLLDMLRYHKFDFANIWAREYGNSDDPEQFKFIYKYSPYHNIRKNIEYPAILFTASENDARTTPVHAMKMTAAMQDANSSENPILLLVHKDSGHGGAVTLEESIAQSAYEWGFLLNEIQAKVQDQRRGLE